MFFFIKELLTQSDMATDDIVKDMEGQRQSNRPNGGWYFPSAGRAGNLVTDLTGRGRGLRPSSPPGIGRGLLAFVIGRERGLRPSSPPTIGRA